MFDSKPLCVNVSWTRLIVIPFLQHWVWTQVTPKCQAWARVIQSQQYNEGGCGLLLCGGCPVVSCNIIKVDPFIVLWSQVAFRRPPARADAVTSGKTATCKCMRTCTKHLLTTAGQVVKAAVWSHCGCKWAFGHNHPLLYGFPLETKRREKRPNINNSNTEWVISGRFTDSWSKIPPHSFTDLSALLSCFNSILPFAPCCCKNEVSMPFHSLLQKRTHTHNVHIYMCVVLFHIYMCIVCITPCGLATVLLLSWMIQWHCKTKDTRSLKVVVNCLLWSATCACAWECIWSCSLLPLCQSSPQLWCAQVISHCGTLGSSCAQHVTQRSGRHLWHTCYLLRDTCRTSLPPTFSSPRQDCRRSSWLPSQFRLSVFCCAHAAVGPTYVHSLAKKSDPICAGLRCHLYPFEGETMWSADRNYLKSHHNHYAGVEFHQSDRNLGDRRCRLVLYCQTIVCRSGKFIWNFSKSCSSSHGHLSSLPSKQGQLPTLPSCVFWPCSATAVLFWNVPLCDGAQPPVLPNSV